MAEPTQDYIPESVSPPPGAEPSLADASQAHLTATTPYQTTPRAVSFSDRATVEQKRSATADEGTPTWPRPASGKIGKYELLEELPPGGMGRVYRARHVELGHVVALKTVRADVGEESARARRFRREAQAVANLDHPHIIDIKDYGEDDGRHYYAMKFIGGGSLAQHRDRYQADVRAAVGLLEKVARAVQHAHDRHIFHRDLKPGNVLLEDSGEPLVSDFGLAKLCDSDEITRPGEVLGTPAYMSPEQAAGRSDQVTAASDVWSLGVMLFELVVGRRPFLGKTYEEVRVHILHDEVPRPRSVRPDVDRSLEAVILKCLEKNPASRYSSAGALARDLGEWLGGKPPSVRPESRLGLARRWIRRKPLIAAAAALVLAGLVTAPAVVYYRDPERPLRAIERDLARGKRVVLVGPNGEARWFQWVPGMGELAQGLVDQREKFEVRGSGFCLLELVHDPQQSRYRFSAEVNHLRSDANGEAGIYFCRSSVGRYEVFNSWTFDDVIPRAPKVPKAGFKENVTMHCIRVFDPEREALRRRQFLSQPFVPADGGGKRWRKLAVDVTPETVRLSWEGKAAGAVSTADLLSNTMDVAAAPPGPLPDIERQLRITPRQGLGLLVTSGAARFKNVVLEPLDQ